MRTGTPFVKPFKKGIEGDEWEELYFHFRELSQAAGAKKQSDIQKSESPLSNESGEGQE